MELVNTLHGLQKTLKAPKGQMNKFGGYKYRSCEDILEAVKPLLPDGVTLIINDELVSVGDRYYVKATASILTNSDVLSATAYAREPQTKKGMDESQITGAASSYARKYALNGLFCIDDTKDADATNTHDKQEHTPEPAPQAPEQAYIEPTPMTDEQIVIWAQGFIDRIREAPSKEAVDHLAKEANTSKKQNKIADCMAFDRVKEAAKTCREELQTEGEK